MSNLKRFSEYVPTWGPYSKKYMGVSRIVDESRKEGVRFDFVIHPTVANTNVPVPNVTFPSNYHPWTCNKDMTHFSYRYDLEWKDQVYADVSFTKINDEAFLVRTEFVNNTELCQICLENIFSALEYPYPQHCKVSLPDKCIFFDAENYASFDYAVTRPWDMENPDGMEKGVFIDPLFHGRKGLGDRIDNAHVHFLNLKPFGCEKGDRVEYSVNSEYDFENPVLVVRYKTAGEGEKAVFSLNGREVTFEKSEDLTFKYIPMGKISKGSAVFELVSEGKAGIEFDFFAVAEKEDVDAITAETVLYERKPEITQEETERGFREILTFGEIGQTYCVMTHNKNTRTRELETGVLEDALISRVSNSDITFDELTRTFTGSFSPKKSDEGFYQNTIVHSLYIKPGTSHIEYVVVSKDRFEPLSDEEYERIYNEGKATLKPLGYNKEGEKYTLSNEILKATLLTNVVYPIYRHGDYIVHHTPGKRWDCLYTWDSGFIALGLLEAEPKLAEYVLDTYLSETDNKDFAFLHHGSPVPVQFYQYLEMLKRENDKTNLYSYYDRAKQYYRFMAGRTHGSTTAKFKSGMTTTYDYFYSSSGMDDYPAQAAMIEKKLEKYACPCISSSQVIRIAKIMKMIAAASGHNEDIAEYDSDIEKLTNALNNTAWDEETGYYSYVLHNENGEPEKFFRTDDGENLNKGMDGIYPLIAGACPEDRKKRVLRHIMNEKEMWSNVGVSAVDRSAGYFKHNGYWNGNVWFSHQWFIWKTMLDLGETDFAFKIADTALNAWRREVDHSYYTFEMFNIESERGGWFHNFGGLSAPINVWANAYYKPGIFTSGFDMWVESRTFNEDNTHFTAKCRYFGNNKNCAVVAVMNDMYDYKVMVNGKETAFNERKKGALEISLDTAEKDITLEIIRK